jgi:hypothetical protein
MKAMSSRMLGVAVGLAILAPCSGLLYWQLSIALGHAVRASPGSWSSRA